jgi:hypothetical protein
MHNFYKVAIGPDADPKPGIDTLSAKFYDLEEVYQF